jgi:hypothetical protein
LSKPEVGTNYLWSRPSDVFYSLFHQLFLLKISFEKY